jgi:hypothetical protein
MADGHHERFQLVISVRSFPQNFKKQIELGRGMNNQRSALLPQKHGLHIP